MKKTIILIADIHPEESSPLFQEWESRTSVEYLKNEIQELGYEAQMIESFKNPQLLLDTLSKQLHRKENCILWNLVEGFSSRNREAYIPSLAEFLGFPYTGADSYSQILTLDKTLTKNIAGNLGIPTPDTVELGSPIEDYNLKFPRFCKPRFEGSSLGINSHSVLHSKLEFQRLISKLPESYFPLLLEEYLPGREFTLAFSGEKGKLRTHQLCEIFVEGVYSEESKSKSAMQEKILPLDDSVYPEIHSATLRLADGIGVSGFGRVDWKLDGKGMPVFLEMNLTPGLSPFYSSFPISYKGEYRDMIQEILSISLVDYESVSRAYGKGTFHKKYVHL